MIKIGIIGHKEVPSYNGGIEAVLTEMIPLFKEQDVELTIYNRWTTFYKISEWKNKQEYAGFKIVRIPTFNKSFLNAFVYSVLASIHAAFSSYDIVHYHAEGPSAMSWIPKITKKKIICTNHGLDWDRSKWGGFATKYLKFGEKISATQSDILIVLSDNISEYFKNTYNKNTTLIRNGININSRIAPQLIYDLGVNPQEYYLAVGRIVPEKGFHYLIDAFSKLDTNKKLVIAGGLTDSEYCLQLQEQAKNNKNIIFAGFVDGDLKKELFSNSFAYVIPSDLEGMSISLLEALSYGCNVIASDISENKNICDKYISFFKQGNVDSLVDELRNVKPHNKESMKNQIKFIENHYDWKHIVSETTEIYKRVVADDRQN